MGVATAEKQCDAVSLKRDRSAVPELDINGDADATLLGEGEFSALLLEVGLTVDTAVTVSEGEPHALPKAETEALPDDNTLALALLVCDTLDKPLPLASGERD